MCQQLRSLIKTPWISLFKVQFWKNFQCQSKKLWVLVAVKMRYGKHFWTKRWEEFKNNSNCGFRTCITAAPNRLLLSLQQHRRDDSLEKTADNSPYSIFFFFRGVEGVWGLHQIKSQEISAKWCHASCKPLQMPREGRSCKCCQTYCDGTWRVCEAENGFKSLHDSRVLLVKWKGSLIAISQIAPFICRPVTNMASAAALRPIYSFGLLCCKKHDRWINSLINEIPKPVSRGWRTCPYKVSDMLP